MRLLCLLLTIAAAGAGVVLAKAGPNTATRAEPAPSYFTSIRIEQFVKCCPPKFDLILRRKNRMKGWTLRLDRVQKQEGRRIVVDVTWIRPEGGGVSGEEHVELKVPIGGLQRGFYTVEFRMAATPGAEHQRVQVYGLMGASGPR